MPSLRTYDFVAIGGGSAGFNAARVAVQGGVFFTGSVNISCHKVLFWTKCDPPSRLRLGFRPNVGS